MGLSKTDVLCDCMALTRWADDPSVPVKFDERMGEYHIVIQTPHGEGAAIIRHCPFCGGKTPASKRARLFARIPNEESARLIRLTQVLNTVSDVIDALGQPDEDNPAGMRIETPEKDGKPGEVQFYRTLRYTNLSEAANVNVTVYSTERVAITFSGKYIGGAIP